jgi:hypothetical protein
MVTTFVWPWKSDEELLEVRALFYPAQSLDEVTRREHQQLAVNIVSHMTGPHSHQISGWRILGNEIH